MFKVIKLYREPQRILENRITKKANKLVTCAWLKKKNQRLQSKQLNKSYGISEVSYRGQGQHGAASLEPNKHGETGKPW